MTSGRGGGGAELARPALTLRLLADGVDFVVANPGPEALRVWDRDCSWGWQTLELELAAGSDGEWTRLVPRPRRWTRNVPKTVEIAPGGSRTFFVPGAESHWEAVERVSHLRDQKVSVRGLLRIPPSAEAEEHGVFIGSVSSPTYVWDPPHEWLGDG